MIDKDFFEKHSKTVKKENDSNKDRYIGFLPREMVEKLLKRIK